VALALVVSIANSSGKLNVLYTLLTLVGYIILMMVVLRPIISRLVKASHRRMMQHEALVLIIMLLFASSWITEVIGISSIFGGFVMGLIVPRKDNFHMKVMQAIEVNTSYVPSSQCRMLMITVSRTW